MGGDDAMTEPGFSELACQELVELVTEYIEGALPIDDRARLEAHLAECPRCREYVRQFAQTTRLIGRIAAADAVPPVSPALLTAFRAWRER